MQSKILTLAKAAEIAHKAQESGKTVVTTNGVFDMLSVPHLRLLEAAKASGDFLLVGINSDVSVKKIKDDSRPIIPESQRLELLAGLECIDGLFLFDEEDPREWLKEVRPDVHVNSSEYSQDCVEAAVVKEIGAELKLVQRSERLLSTSDVIEVIKEKYCS
ncbi:adenylyltransferase/cytidyltransferase family protein [Patescibacteria group bacterium]|nr:adenylyltransferase/cytidyltransferase family protein [Patescibacteria group bacterium]MBU1123624.1 adenylyltransferase/cytidyltransferase family protein [Patescibacteria group bacterium]